MSQAHPRSPIWLGAWAAGDSIGPGGDGVRRPLGRGLLWRGEVLNSNTFRGQTKNINERRGPMGIKIQNGRDDGKQGAPVPAKWTAGL